jgi:hypothetical protein
MVILPVIEQETFSAFVTVASILLVGKLPVMGLPFDGMELWLSSNLESLARRGIPIANHFQDAHRAGALGIVDQRPGSTDLGTSILCSLESLFWLLGSASRKFWLPAHVLDLANDDVWDHGGWTSANKSCNQRNFHYGLPDYARRRPPPI